MNDEDNPYRFTGNIERRDSSPTPALEIDALRRIAPYRYMLVAATIVHYAGWFLMVLASDPTPWVDDDYVFACGVICILPLAVLGAIMMPWLSPRLAFVKALALLVPLLNVVVVAYVLRDARRRLEEQGADARSRATSDPAGDEARSE